MPYIIAEPLPSNLLEWHYVVRGPEDSPYKGRVVDSFFSLCESERARFPWAQGCAFLSFINNCEASNGQVQIREFKASKIKLDFFLYFLIFFLRYRLSLISHRTRRPTGFSVLPTQRLFKLIIQRQIQIMFKIAPDAWNTSSIFAVQILCFGLNFCRWSVPREVGLPVRVPVQAPLHLHDHTKRTV